MTQAATKLQDHKLDHAFWSGLRITSESVAEMPDSEIVSSIRKWLQDSPVPLLQQVSRALGVQITISEPAQLIEQIATHPRARELQCLKRFVKSRFFAVRERFGENHPILYLMVQYFTNRQVLDGIYLEAAWGKRGPGDKYFMDGAQMELSPLADKARVAAAIAASSPVPQGVQIRHYDQNLQGYTLFQVGSKRTNTISEEVKQNREITPLRPAIFKFDQRTKTLEVRGLIAKGQLEAILKQFRVLLNCEFQPEVQSTTTGDSTKFLGFLTADPQLGVGICEISVRRSLLPNQPPITLGNPLGPDVRPAVKAAIEQKLIQISDLADLDSLVFDSPEIGSRRLTIERLSRGVILPSVQEKSLTTAERKLLGDQIEAAIGLRPGIKVSPTLTTFGMAATIDTLVAEMFLSDVPPYATGILNDIKKMGIIELQSLSCKICRACGKGRPVSRVREKGMCRECRREVTFKKETLSVVSPVPTTIETWIDDWIGRQGVTTVKHSELSFQKQKFSFRILLADGATHQLHVCHAYLSDEVIKWLGRTKPRLTIIHVGANAQKRLGVPEWCNQFTLGELIMSERPGGKKLDLKEALRTERRYQENSVLRTARLSANSLTDFLAKTKTEYSSEDFEKDVFGILREVFPNSIQWGHEDRGKPWPEGALGLAHGTGNQRQKFSVSWDCKLATKNKPYDFTIDEKRKVADYVSAFRQADAIKNFSGDLDAFLVISNNISATQIDGLAKHIGDNMSDWKGSVCLVDADAITALHNEYKENQREIRLRSEAFVKRIQKLFTTPKGKLSNHITKESIEDLMTETLRQAAGTLELDLDGLDDELRSK